MGLPMLVSEYLRQPDSPRHETSRDAERPMRSIRENLRPNMVTRPENRRSSQAVGNELASSGARTSRTTHNRGDDIMLASVRGRPIAWHAVERAQGERSSSQSNSGDMTPSILSSTSAAILISEETGMRGLPELIETTAIAEPVDAEIYDAHQDALAIEVEHVEFADNLNSLPAATNREPREQRREQGYQRPSLSSLNGSQSENATSEQVYIYWRARVRERLIEIVSEYMDVEGVPPARQLNIFHGSPIDALFSDDPGQLMINPDLQRIQRIGQQHIAVRTLHEELRRADAQYAGTLVEGSLEEEYTHAYRLLDHLNARGELRLEMQARLQRAIDEMSRQEQTEETWSLSS